MATGGRFQSILILVIITLTASTAFANYLADITVSKDSPASLPNNWIIEVACDWQWDGAGHDVEASVMALPMTNGEISPGAWVEDFQIPAAGSGKCWPNFTIQTGSVVVDEILLVMENSPPEYERLLELSIPVELHFGPHAFYGIDVDFATPNRMQFDQFIMVDFIWETDYAGDKRIVARGLTGDSFTPGQSYIGSPLISGTSGLLTRGFTVRPGGEVAVTAILFEMYNGDWSQLIHSFTLPVNYRFVSTAIQNIEFNPPFPASRMHNNNIAVDFDYLTDHPTDPVVTITPYTDGAPTPGGEVTPTLLAPGSGHGSTVFDVLPAGGMTDVDAVLIEMRDFFDPDILIDSFFVPVYYHFANHAVRAVEYDPLPPAILSNGTYVDVTLTWESGYRGEGYLHMIPRSWGVDTPDVDGYLRSITYPGYNAPKLHFFTVTTGNRLVDHLHLDATTYSEDILWMDYFHPAWFQFAGPSVLMPVEGASQAPAPVLLGNFPNPFNPRTEIAFELPEAVAVTLEVYDVAGRLVKVLVDGEVRPQGRGRAVWDGTDRAGHGVGAGVYFYRLEAAGTTATGRMALVD